MILHEQLDPVLVVGLSAIFVPRHLERVTWRLGTMATAVVVGVLVVSVSRGARRGRSPILPVQKLICN